MDNHAISLESGSRMFNSLEFASKAEKPFLLSIKINAIVGLTPAPMINLFNFSTQALSDLPI